MHLQRELYRVSEFAVCIRFSGGCPEVALECRGMRGRCTESTLIQYFKAFGSFRVRTSCHCKVMAPHAQAKAVDAAGLGCATQGEGRRVLR